MAFVDNTFSFEEFDLDDEIDEIQPLSPVVVETPSPVVVETPSPVVDETPSPVVDETPSPVVVETPSPVIDETDETDIDETEMPDLIGSLAEIISSNLGDEIEAAVRDATKLLTALRKKQRSIKKAAKKAAVGPKPRGKYGEGIPTAAQLFAKANRAIAVDWYNNGGRIPDFNSAKAQQISKRLAIMWKLAPRDTRAEFDDMRNGIIAQKEEAIAAAAGVPIAA
ncbi:hypothetical protein EXVG_00168 [Emiliania huxleyi virus 202]|nr:hypothetical protein EXVG_00168 [Emiliania huxleyi virus 202]AHA54398.1 hypothetical protein EhV18_00352 [Emiliania huxleyi virus 18]AHA55439.1 hypothetical protein EhV156_00344 [Emiliania huxleyi virus 156]